MVCFAKNTRLPINEPLHAIFSFTSLKHQVVLYLNKHFGSIHQNICLKLIAKKEQGTRSNANCFRSACWESVEDRKLYRVCYSFSNLPLDWFMCKETVTFEYQT